MASLTPKQEAFVLVYLETGNASAAYRRSYNAESMTEEAINVEASRLLKNPKIALRLGVVQQRVQAKAEAKALLSLDDHMDELRVLRELAKQGNQLSAAITAEVKRGELRKFYVKQVENGGPGDFDNMSDDDLRKFIATTTAGSGEGQENAARPRRSGKAGKQLN